MKIQYFSDVHLEFFDEIKPSFIESLIVKEADILVLAGDIGDPFSIIYKNFIEELSKMFEKVFIIAGNHEYYNKLKTIEEINEQIRKICKNNITFLDNSYEDYNDYRFVGSVLWSKIDNKNYLTNDFYHIKNMTIKEYNNLHNSCKHYLEDVLETDKKVIIITHFLPSVSLIDLQFSSYSKYNQCFSSSCDYLIKSPIVCWIYGHTHKSNITKINSIQVCCNPIGYPGENLIVDFNKIIII